MFVNKHDCMGEPNFWIPFLFGKVKRNLLGGSLGKVGLEQLFVPLDFKAHEPPDGVLHSSDEPELIDIEDSGLERSE